MTWGAPIVNRRIPNALQQALFPSSAKGEPLALKKNLKKWINGQAYCCV
jgi:hypothetical protein